MKFLKNNAFYITNIVLICMISFGLLNAKIEQNKTKVTVDNKRIPSVFLTFQSKEEPSLIEETSQEIEEKTIEEQAIEKVEEPITKIEEPKEEIVVVEEPVFEEPQETIIEIVTGKLSGYGPDCYGCTSNRTASGQDVSDGKIYYEDATYGKIRIVSGDRKYPMGTIVRMSNLNFTKEPILAIVLDRGGSIGFGKAYLFDLLYATEKEAAAFGVSNHTTFEILRLGY